MEGLASIALAVEHLERIEEGRDEYVAAVGKVKEPASAPPMPPLPVSTGFQSQARVVSLESLPTSTVGDLPLVSPQSLRPVSGEFSNLLSRKEQEGRVSPANGLIDLLDANMEEVPPPPPPTEIIEVKDADVLSGRGGETNHHPGNIKYRQLVKICQPAYIEAKRRDKPKIAEKIVLAVRKLGGRFLKKDAESNKWHDVGNKKAREKTSQALREGAPEMRNGLPPKRGSLNHLASKPSSLCTIESSSPSSPMMKRLIEVTVPRVVDATCTIGESLPSPSKKQKMTIGGFRNTEPSCSSPPCGSIYGAPAEVTSPGSFPATISADDEDDSKSLETKGEMTSRGPRLKLLKKRLECDATI